MTIIIMIFGLICIAIGYFMKAYATASLKYNKKKKKSPDEQRVEKVFQGGFMICGVGMIAVYFLLRWTGFRNLSEFILLAPFIAIPLMILLSLTSTKGIRDRLIMIGTALLFVGVLVVQIYDFLPTKPIINTNSIEFSGNYGVKIRYSEIEKVELLQTIPYIRARTNGYALAGVLKGFFTLNKYGK